MAARSAASLAITLRLKRKRAADERACAVKKAPTGRKMKEGEMGEGGRDERREEERDGGRDKEEIEAKSF